MKIEYSDELRDAWIKIGKDKGELKAKFIHSVCVGLIEKEIESLRPPFTLQNPNVVRVCNNILDMVKQVGDDFLDL